MWMELYRLQPHYFLPLHAIRTVGNLVNLENLRIMNMHEAEETNLPMKSHVTIKYSSITMMSYWDFLT